MRTDGKLLRNKSCTHAQKMDSGFEGDIHGRAFKSEKPKLKPDLLRQCLIYVSDEGTVYLANENSVSPVPLPHIQRVEQFLLCNSSQSSPSKWICKLNAIKTPCTPGMLHKCIQVLIECVGKCGLKGKG
jgi:hypothetical protein